MRIIAGRFKGVPLTTPRSVTRPTTDRTKEAIFSRLDSWGVLQNARVLDLYAGTGALGFEALSRGARELVLVEADAQAARLIARTASILRHQRAWSADMDVHVIRARAERYAAKIAQRNERNAELAHNEGDAGTNDIARNERNVQHSQSQSGESTTPPLHAHTPTQQHTLEQFNVVLMDPPYAVTTEECNQLLNTLVSGGVVAPDGLMMLERSTRSEAPSAPTGWRIDDQRDYGETAVFYMTAE